MHTRKLLGLKSKTIKESATRTHNYDDDRY